MKKSAFTIVEIIIVISLLALVAIIFVPMNITNVPQAKRIAKWQTTYEQIDYSIHLVKLHNKDIFSSANSPIKEYTEEDILNNIKKYLNLENEEQYQLHKKYVYTFLNRSNIKETSQFYFNKFYLLKNNVLFSLKLNENRYITQNVPFAYIFIDINAEEKPNKIGKDIFIINLYSDHISALGDGYSLSDIRTSCSPIGNGLYCSKYYLIGGNF